jgi:hypothetical protein
MRKLIAASLIAAAAGFPLSSAARTDVDVFVNVAPPPLRHEVVPVPRVGHIWVPGVWEWRHGKHYWVRGRWVAERRGYFYEPAHWVERGGRHYYYQGAWRRR